MPVTANGIRALWAGPSFAIHHAAGEPRGLAPPHGRIADQQDWETAAETLPRLLINEVGDDRDRIQPGDRVLLIVENDLGFARFLLDAAREKGFKGLVTSLGAAALALTREYKPHAITLDIFLPDIDGWRVLERLKNDMTTRHIPVCVISTEEARERALQSGALAFVAKPIPDQETLDELLDGLQGRFSTVEQRSLLVVEPDAARRERIRGLLAGSDIDVLTAGDSDAALRLLHEQPIDCLIVDAAPLVVIGASLSALTRSATCRCRSSSTPSPGPSGDGGQPMRTAAGGQRTARFCRFAASHSPERLLDQTAFFLHQRREQAARSATADAGRPAQSDKVLAGKKVLIVDDDMRNIFALSTVLEEHDMAIVSADNGRDAIQILQQQAGHRHRADGHHDAGDGRHRHDARDPQDPAVEILPIIAVTAKAMKGDREKCIEAGAWDYLSKPVDTEQMLAVLRAWLHR